MDGADVCRTSSRSSRRPPNVTCGAAILDSRWRRRKWRQPGLGVLFSTPIEGEVQNGGPTASGHHLGWPHFRFRKWGHPRWRPEAEGPPFCTSPSMGIEKSTLYYSCLWRLPGIPPSHYDVIKWKHFPRYWPFVRGIYRSPMNSPHKAHRRAARGPDFEI